MFFLISSRLQPWVFEWLPLGTMPNNHGKGICGCHWLSFKFAGTLAVVTVMRMNEQMPRKWVCKHKVAHITKHSIAGQRIRSNYLNSNLAAALSLNPPLRNTPVPSFRIPKPLLVFGVWKSAFRLWRLGRFFTFGVKKEGHASYPNVTYPSGPNSSTPRERPESKCVHGYCCVHVYVCVHHK